MVRASMNIGGRSLAGLLLLLISVDVPQGDEEEELK
jgi:hypothetical protein